MACTFSGVNRWIGLSCLFSVAFAGSGCGGFGPSCIDEQGTILTSSGIVAAGETTTTSVRSPRSSNLIIRLRWEPGSMATGASAQAEPRLGLRATITDCGGHVGCAMLTSAPASSPGGPGPGPHVWPAGFVEMLVDGWVGKTYQVEVVGVPEREMPYRLEVLYRIDCES